MAVKFIAKTLLYAWIGVLAVVFFSGNVSAKPFDSYAKCYQDWWCVEEKPVGEDSLQIWLINQTDHPVTITVEIHGENLLTAQGNPSPEHISTTLNAHQRKNIISLVSKQQSKLTWVDTRYHWVAGTLDAQHDDSVRYQLPFAAGQKYRMVQGFGGGYSHYGASKYAVDFAMPVGTPVHAAREGVVIDTEQQYSRGGASRRYAGYANYIVILHSDGTTGEYYHLQQNGVSVDVGEQVALGQFIGLSGNTGFSSLPHLHFAVYQAKPFGEFQSVPFKFNQGALPD